MHLQVLENSNLVLEESKNMLIVRFRDQLLE